MSETITPSAGNAGNAGNHEQSGRMLRRLFRLVLLTAGIGFALQVFLLTPLYVRFASDVSYQNAWWVYVLYYLTSEGLLDLAVFAVCYAATVYAVWCVGLKRAIRIPVWYAVLTVAKFFFNFAMTSITDSALPDPEEFFSMDLPILLGMLAPELLQYIIVVAVIFLIKRRHESRARIAEGMKLLPRSQQVDYSAPTPAFPFVGLVSFKNPLQLAGFLSALTIFVARFSMHMIYQITLFTKFGYSDGWAQMLIDLISDLAISVVVYFVCLLLFNRFHEWETEKADRA